MTTRRPRRGGFTLIELLTVIAILALLAALTAAGVGRVRVAQQVRNSEQTVTKLQLALDQQWKATIDQAMQDKLQGKIPAAVVTFCGNDNELSASVWAYILTRREFPQTFAEAKGDIKITGLWQPPPTTPPYLQPRNTFTSAGLPASGANAEEEAAGLLYLILADKSNRGMVFNADDATQGAQGLDSRNSFKVFLDAWRTPISFVRYANKGYANELDAHPYVNTNTAIPKQDPLDPKAKLFNWSATSKQAVATVFAGGSGSATSFDGSNRQPAVLSAGENKAWDENGSVYGGDNLVGYRLRGNGNRGN